MKLSGAFLIALALGAAPVRLSAQSPERLSVDERKYLLELAGDTYRYLDFTRDAETGLPNDNSRHAQHPDTSVTNIGLHLANLVGAVELGLETRASAVEKAQRIIRSMQGARYWNGHPYSWMYTEPNRRHNDSFVSSVDLGNYYAGVIVARQYFPELQADCDKILAAANWSKLYNPTKKLLYGGFDARKNRYTDWNYSSLGSEARLASVVAIAMGGAPLECWSALDRTLEKRYGIEYLKPGWQGGGLFLGYLAGLFLDERGTVSAISAGNFARAQMLHAEKLNYPVWGWSASDSPQDGYLGYNAIRDHVITPHASCLALAHFPEEVARNLKRLDELGLRPVHVVGGKQFKFGFRDAFDIKTGRVTPGYLMLDQSMIFLTLVNFYKDRVISRQFESYAPVRETLAKLPDFSRRVTPEMVGFPINLAKLTGTRVMAIDLDRPVYKVYFASVSPMVNLQEWGKAEILPFSNEFIEAGKIADQRDFYATVSSLWDKDYLYVQAVVRDQSIHLPFRDADIYKGDIVEYYFNPDGQGLVWGNSKDFQIGITPPGVDGTHSAYAWFQKKKPGENDIKVVSQRMEGGYQVVAAFSWKFLRMKEPTRGLSFGASIGMNDADEGRLDNTKLNWFFRNEEGKTTLGKMILQ